MIHILAITLALLLAGCDGKAVRPGGGASRSGGGGGGADDGDGAADDDPSIETDDSPVEGKPPASGAPAAVVTKALLTDSLRSHKPPAAGMTAGWGPHLKGLMRDATDRLWFVADEGASVQTNDRLRYLVFEGGAWKESGSQANTAGVQQNVASLLRGNIIFSYGVNVTQGYLEECYFDVTNPAYKACNAVLISGAVHKVAAGSNYVGAALGPKGAKVVWWTTSDGNGGAGQWQYIYDFGGGWNGPVAASLGGANDLGYVYARFLDDNRLFVAGERYYGKYPTGHYGAGAATFDLGNAPAFSDLRYTDGSLAGSPEDVWADPASGAVHVLARHHESGMLCYYFKPKDEPWSAHDQPVATFDKSYRGRFTVAQGRFVFARTGSNGAPALTILHVPAEQAAGPVDWSKAEAVDPAFTESGFDLPNALWIETPVYQTVPVKELNLALDGKYPDADQIAWHVRVVWP